MWPRQSPLPNLNEERPHGRWPVSVSEDVEARGKLLLDHKESRLDFKSIVAVVDQYSTLIHGLVKLCDARFAVDPAHDGR